MTKNKHRCRHCNHTWVPRKANPKRCPRCGRSNWRATPGDGLEFDGSDSSLFPGLANE